MRMTIQEMFDRAVRGLASQGFQQAVEGNACVYDMPMSDGSIRHCAWGWVDTELGNVAGEGYNVTELRLERLGLAADLSDDELCFAQALQEAHDRGDRPAEMVRLLRSVALQFGLTYPADTVT